MQGRGNSSDVQNHGGDSAPLRSMWPPHASAAGIETVLVTTQVSATHCHHPSVPQHCKLPWISSLCPYVGTCTQFSNETSAFAVLEYVSVTMEVNAAAYACTEGSLGAQHGLHQARNW